ncbi:MAG: glycosyltransferase family 4 protein [Alphaproteobacteria bacterium]
MSIPEQIGLDWQLTGFTGWGVFGINLALTLKRRGGPMPVILRPPIRLDLDPLRERFLADETRWANEVAGPARERHGGRVAARIPVLHALGSQLGREPDPTAGRPDIGVVFLEGTRLSPEAMDRAGGFARLLAGSTWLSGLLRRRGIGHVVPVLQGIDPTLFHPGPRTRPFGDRFVVFSGGKLELRKGQDLVIEAFRRVRDRHRDALLVTAWQNPWPESARSLAAAGKVPFGPDYVQGRGHDIDAWLGRLGLPAGAHVDLGYVPNASMAAVLRECDVAVLPSRAEGGTNLVAMECMAVGLPTIVSANTGHLDLLALDGGAIALRGQGSVRPLPPEQTEGWGESDVDEIVAAIQTVRADPAAARARGERTAAWMRAEWSWDRRVGQLVEAVAEVA